LRERATVQKDQEEQMERRVRGRLAVGPAGVLRTPVVTACLVILTACNASPSQDLVAKGRQIFFNETF
jgi:hypothetical protein